MAVQIDGTETEAELAAIKALNPIVALLATKDGVSRLHSSRRVFDVLKRHGITTPVIHRITFPAGTVRDEIVITTGSLVGGLLVGVGCGCGRGCGFDFWGIWRYLAEHGRHGRLGEGGAACAAR